MGIMLLSGRSDVGSVTLAEDGMPPIAAALRVASRLPLPPAPIRVDMLFFRARVRWPDARSGAQLS